MNGCLEVNGVNVKRHIREKALERGVIDMAYICPCRTDEQAFLLPHRTHRRIFSARSLATGIELS
jgi:hypothetical protein